MSPRAFPRNNDKPVLIGVRPVAALWLTFGFLLSCQSAPDPPSSGKPGQSSKEHGHTVAAPVAPRIAPPPLDATAPSDYPGLHNVVTYSDGLYSGSAPEGDVAFETLKGMGIQTVISVDGAAPEVEAARKQGIRYIHLPIGYNGMDHTRTMEIAKAVKLADGPVYVHCHHGKHRSAGATGAAAVTLGLLTNEEAEKKLKVSGTAPSYKGLYQCVAVAKPASREELAAIPSDFPEIWKTSGMVRTMVEVEEASDHLKEIEKAGWKAPPEHPDLVPVAEAGHLADLLRNLHDDSAVKAKSPAFQKDLSHASQVTESLEEALLQGSSSPQELSAQFAVIMQTCKDCHARHRD